MLVNDFILQIRSRLSDVECKKWNDIEILDSINLAYINLARVLRIFLQQRRYEVTNSLMQDLPINLLDIKIIIKNNRQIPIVRAYEETNLSDYVSISNDKIIFSSSGNYIVTYYCYYTIVDKHDSINLPSIANNALLFYALYLLLQKKPHQNALQEVQFYKGLYEIELKELQRDIYRSHETKYLVSKFILV